jgi:hypothetical protein
MAGSALLLPDPDPGSGRHGSFLGKKKHQQKVSASLFRLGIVCQVPGARTLHMRRGAGCSATRDSNYSKIELQLLLSFPCAARWPAAAQRQAAGPEKRRGELRRRRPWPLIDPACPFQIGQPPARLRSGRQPLRRYGAHALISPGAHLPKYYGSL